MKRRVVPVVLVIVLAGTCAGADWRPAGVARQSAETGESVSRVLPYVPQAQLARNEAAPSTQGLRVSDSGHYFTYRGRVIMLVGDSGTQCVMQNLNIDYRAWIDDLSSRGLNAAHIWALLAPRQKEDGSLLEARYGYVYPGATPWKRKAAPEGDGRAFSKWDLTAFDEGTDPNRQYWPRLRDLAQYARQNGMCLGVTLFFGWPKHDTEARNDWAIHPFNAANGGHLESRYETMVIDTPGTEVLEEAWSDSWARARKTQWVWETYAQKMIGELGAFDNLFFVYKDERSYDGGPWQDNMAEHMLSFFRRRGHFLLVDWEASRGSVDAVMVATPGTEKNSLAAQAFAGEPARPVVLLESPPYALGGPAVRLSMWSFAMGGGHFFFHDDAEQGTPTTGIMGYDPNVPGGVKPLLTYDWLGHLGRFFNRHVPLLDAAEPHNELVLGGQGYCLADPGTAYMCYLPAGGRLTLDLSSVPGAPTVDWFNPRTGEMTRANEPAAPEGGNLSLTAPDNEDWAVLVRKQ